MSTETHGLLTQDLTDVLQINVERVAEFNACAYACDNLILKNLLNRELDNSRDSIQAIKRLLAERFENLLKPVSTGHLLSVWSDFKPSFSDVDFDLQLHAFEMADLLTLQCYRTLIARPYIDEISKDLLEFLYQNHFDIYKSLKGFRQLHVNHHSADFPSQKMA